MMVVRLVLLVVVLCGCCVPSISCVRLVRAVSRTRTHLLSQSSSLSLSDADADADVVHLSTSSSLLTPDEIGKGPYDPKADYIVVKTDAQPLKTEFQQDMQKLAAKYKKRTKKDWVPKPKALLELSVDGDLDVESDAVVGDGVGDGVGVGVGVPGDVVGLVIGGLPSFIPVQPGVNHVAYTGRAHQPIACVLTIDQAAAWSPRRIYVKYNTPGGGGGSLLVFNVGPGNNGAGFNLPAGVVRFTLNFETALDVPILNRLYTFQLTYQPITFGLELEDILAKVRLCRIDVTDPNCLNHAATDVICQTPNMPGTNIPFLKIGLETNAHQPKSAILEYITGPLSVGSQNNEVTRDAADANKALSHLMAAFYFSLSTNAGVCGANADDATFYTPLDPIITVYNGYINADAHFMRDGVNSRPNWILTMPANSAKTVLNNAGRFWRHYIWRLRCMYSNDANFARKDIQVNFIMPLAPMAARKAIALTNTVTQMTHFVDLFPDSNPFVITGPYVTRCQYVAEQILAGPVFGAGIGALGLTPLQLNQFKGFLAALIMTLVHQTQLACASDAGEETAGGAGKNFHVVLLKSCLNDLPRYFATGLTTLFRTWWTGAHTVAGTRNGNLDAIIALLSAPAGVVGVGVWDYGKCAGYVNGAAAINWNAAQQFRQRFIEAVDDRATTVAVISANWAPRYPGENAVMGDQGSNAVNPGNAWRCMSGAATDKTYPPFRARLFGELGILVEARNNEHNLNQAFQPSQDPNAPADWRDPLNAIRRITTAV